MKGSMSLLVLLYTTDYCEEISCQKPCLARRQFACVLGLWMPVGAPSLHRSLVYFAAASDAWLFAFNLRLFLLKFTHGYLL